MSYTQKLTTGSLKRSLALTAAGAMALAVMPVGTAFASHAEICPAPSDSGDADKFSDDDGTTHEDNINCLVSYDIAQGFEDGTYGAGQSITRAQMATFIANYVETATGTALAEGDDVFSDDEGNVHEANINAIANAGIVQGDADGNYNPGAFVTRDQMATFIANATELVMGSDLADGDDAFTDDEGNVHEGNINKLAEAGIVGGIGGGLYNPSGDVTRGAMASFVMNAAAFLYDNNMWAPVDNVETNATATARPELVSAKIVNTVLPTQATTANPAGTRIEYTFDENVDLVAPTPASFYAIAADGVTRYAGNTNISRDGSTVVVNFTGIVTQDDADALTLTTVDMGAVTDNDGVTNPEGSAAIGEASSSTVGTAGVTNAPDLVAVSTAREAASGTGNSVVDFTFDEAASQTAPSSNGFKVVLLNGTVVTGTGPATTTPPSGGTVAGGDGTTTITVEFAGLDRTVAIARGYVDAGTVADASANANVLQAADTTNSGNSSDPDLVSAEFRPSTTGGVDQVLYTFDEGVAAAPTAASFQVYAADGSALGTGTAAARNTVNTAQVLVDFPNGTLANKVGASVLQGAVVASDNAAQGKADEVGVTNSQTSARTPGQVAAPQLLSVAIDQGTDAFGNPTGYRATYTFDENVDLAVTGNFFIYSADGTKYTASACTDGVTATAADTSDDATVTCTGFGAATDAQIGAAVLGTVDNGAVDEKGAGGLTNHEGAAVTTGGTGTPAA